MLKLNADKMELLWAEACYGSTPTGRSGLSVQLRDEIITASNHVHLYLVSLSRWILAQKGMLLL